MSWRERIQRWWRGRKTARNIARLEDGSEVQEEVDLSRGPLKPGQRRRALRDERLLPRRRTLLRRPRVMQRPETARLFSNTLRTADRNLRDLLPDREQLERYGLPPWESDDDVAQALEISVKELWFFSSHRDRERHPHYITYALPKRSGGRRLILAPKRRLKALQRSLLRLLIERLPVGEQAHGFRRGRSIRSAAEQHVGKTVLLHLDIADFFPSVHFGRVRGYLIAMGYGFPVASTLAALMTECERQPVQFEDDTFHVPVGPRHCVQGAPTSPGLCNAIVHRLDRRLAGLAKAFDYGYTRYADDLTFSGNDASQVQALRSAACRILTDEGFEPNRKKTRIERRTNAQRVSGVTVNDVVGLSRRERRKLRAMAHQAALKERSGELDLQTRRRLEGKLAYLAMLNPSQADALRPDFLRKPANG